MKKDPLVILSGPTAAGKTELSIRLAKEIDGEIISADSMQVYRGFDIGTAKITPEQMQGVPHYLIDICDPQDSFSVFEFQKYAAACIKDILKRGKIPIIVGGTGFYIQSVLYDIDFTESKADPSLQGRLEDLYRKEGAEGLHRHLRDVDPQSADLIHPNNIKRVMRAISFFYETGEPISRHNIEQRARESSYNFAYLVLNRDRSVIYDRINKRVDQMLADGLVEEVKSLLCAGVSEDDLAMQGLGYKEILSYLNGNSSLEEAAELLKKSTRHFAKRQITWFKREKDVIWLNYEDYADTTQMLQKILMILKEKKIVPIS